MMDPMPAGWIEAKIIELVRLHDNRRVPLNASQRGEMKGSFPYYGANGLVDCINDYLFDGDYTLLAEDGGYFDEPLRGVAYEVSGKFWVNNHAHILEPLGGISTSFIRHMLNNVNWLPFVSGSTRLKLTQGGLQRVTVNLPPLPEQRRIVAKIDDVSAKSKRARDHLDHIPRLVEKYKQAILAAGFQGTLLDAASQTCVFTPISSLILSLDQGWSPKCESEPALEATDWAVIKTTAIQPMQFIEEENKRLPSHLKHRPQIEIKEGDVLITRAGPRSRVAVSCMVPTVRPRLMLCDKSYRLRVNPKVAAPGFLTYMLNAPQSLATLEEMKTGINDSGLNLTQAKFLALGIPQRSLDEQATIVSRIETAFSWIARLAVDLTRARKLIGNLDQAVLAKAFRGELVPQDPNDEPASVLLEQIKSSKVEAPAGKRSTASKRSPGDTGGDIPGLFDATV